MSDTRDLFGDLPEGDPYEAHWEQKAMMAFRAEYHSGDLITGEDVRLKLEKQGLSAPSNNWGNLINKISQRHLIRDTGKTTWAKDPKANRRRLVLWRVI